MSWKHEFACIHINWLIMFKLASSGMFVTHEVSTHLEVNVNQVCVGVRVAVELGLELHAVGALGRGRNELQAVSHCVVHLRSPAVAVSDDHAAAHMQHQQAALGAWTQGKSWGRAWNFALLRGWQMYPDKEHRCWTPLTCV